MPASDVQFMECLRECVNLQLSSPLPEQRRMLTGERPFPARLFAAPRVPGECSRHHWHPFERHTFGDMFGIVGILTAYGNLFGTRLLPELLHGKYLPPDGYNHPTNIFCIGSPKVNDATAHFLPLVQRGRSPQWDMKQVGTQDDPRVIIQGDPELDARLSAPIEIGSDGCTRDYGLVIRAPHPSDDSHIVLIVAGRHSIGTHAACTAVTRKESIVALEKHLKAQGVSLRTPRQLFWAIVCGTLQPNQSIDEDVEIVRTGGYR
jgi:hypothetical protein